MGRAQTLSRYSAAGAYRFGFHVSFVLTELCGFFRSYQRSLHHKPLRRDVAHFLGGLFLPRRLMGLGSTFSYAFTKPVVFAPGT